MTTPRTFSAEPPASPRWRGWLGALLLVVGLLGHLFAAHAMGGYRIAYRDHVAGYFLILAVTGGLIALLGWRFWRGRRDLELLVVGAVQALFGIWIYVAQVTGHGPR